MSRKIYDARRYDQGKNDIIVDKRLQGLEYPEEMRDIKESCAALLISVPLHNFDKKYQPKGAGGTQSPPAMLHRLQNPKRPPGASKLPTGSRMGVPLGYWAQRTTFEK